MIDWKGKIKFNSSRVHWRRRTSAWLVETDGWRNWMLLRSRGRLSPPCVLRPSKGITRSSWRIRLDKQDRRRRKPCWLGEKYRVSIRKKNFSNASHICCLCAKGETPEKTHGHNPLENAPKLKCPIVKLFGRYDCDDVQLKIYSFRALRRSFQGMEIWYRRTRKWLVSKSFPVEIVGSNLIRGS